MTTARKGDGLYVAFPVRADRSLRQFIEGMPPGLGEALDLDDLHITAMYPEELSVYELGRSERRKLDGSVRPVMRALGHIPLTGSALEPSADEEGLISCSKFAAILLEPSEEVEAARTAIVDVIEERIGIELPYQKPNGWHLSVARKRRRGAKLPPYEKPLPETVTIGGLHIIVRKPRGELAAQRQTFVNRSQSFRAKRGR